MRKAGTTGYRHRTARSIISALATTAAVSMLPIMGMPMQASADEDDTTCSKEDKGVYHLSSDCTLHISSGYMHTSSSESPISQNLKVRSIVIDDPAGTSFYNDDATNAFSWFKNTESITGLEKLNVSHVTRFTGMFNGLGSMKTPVDLSSWDVSSGNVFTNMFTYVNLDMFKGYEKFRMDGSDLNFAGMFEFTHTTGSIDLSGWRISATNISSMQGMFAGTTAPGGISIKGDLAKKGARENQTMFSYVDTSGIDGLDGLNMGRSIETIGMFSHAKITKPIDLSSWDMSAVTDAGNMFSDFNAPSEQDLSSWNTGSMKRTAYMFQNSPDISRFKGIDKWDLSKVENASGMYSGTKSSKPVRIPANMPKLTNASFMFSYTDIDDFTNLADLYIPGTTDASYMFMLASGNYLNMSKMGLSAANLNIQGMVGTPSIKYLKFGSMFVGHTDKAGPGMFNITKDGKTWNAWDDPALPSYNQIEKSWSRLPYDDRGGKFDGTIESLGSGDSWMNQSMWWSSLGLDDDLYKALDNPGTIIFRMVVRPVRFHENITGYDDIIGMPDMTSSIWAVDNFHDRIPEDKVPVISQYHPNGRPGFTGWNTKPDGTGKSYKYGEWLGAGTEAIDLYAQWNGLKKVPVRFNDKTGQATGMPENAEKHPGDSYTIPADSPKRPGYRFKGWATTENGKPAHQPGDTITIGSNVDAIDLYPVWEQTGTGVLPAAGLSAKTAPIIAAAGALLLIPMSVFMIRRHRRI